MSGKNREKFNRNLMHIEELLNFFFPQRCVFCGKYVEDFSKKGDICNLCEEKMKSELKPSFKKDVENFEGLWYLGFYRGMLKEGINRFKFFGERSLGKYFGFCLSQLIAQYPFNFDVITFIPMHRSKKLKRGYNQSELVAKSLSQNLKIKKEKIIEKIKKTPPQSSLNKNKRGKNVKGVFSVLYRNKSKYSSILLIDDIYTTGNTVKEAVFKLKESGFSKIYCAVLAIDYLL